MGEVYEARDTRLNRTVAVKVLPGSVSADADRRVRFEREARAISALDHPHICALYDVGEHDGTMFLVMQYLDGQNLASALASGALPLDRVLGCAIQIADALDFAHRRGIVHRDVKPANIMLTKTGARLLDVGLAKPRAPAASLAPSGLTQPAGPETGDGILLGGGLEPHWRGDGKELFYLALDRKLMAVPVAGTASTFESGAPHALFETHTPYSSPGYRVTYDVTADGQRFLVNTAVGGGASSSATVVLNWTGALKK